MREKKYTKTVAFRVTAEEWELIQNVIASGVPIGHRATFSVPTKPSDVLRGWVTPYFDAQRHRVAEAAKKAEAAAKRAAKKAAADVNA